MVMMVRELPELKRGGMSFVSLTRPVYGHAPAPWTMTELNAKYVRTTDKIAEPRWNAEYWRAGTGPDDSPELRDAGYVSRKKDGTLAKFNELRIKVIRLVAGTVLPVWNSVVWQALIRTVDIGKSTQPRFDVLRMETTDTRQKLIGIQVGDRAVDTLRELAKSHDAQDEENYRRRVLNGLLPPPQPPVEEEDDGEVYFVEDDEIQILPDEAIEVDLGAGAGAGLPGLQLPGGVADDLAGCGLSLGVRLLKAHGRVVEDATEGEREGEGIPMSDDEDGMFDEPAPVRFLTEARPVLPSEDEEEGAAAAPAPARRGPGRPSKAGGAAAARRRGGRKRRVLESSSDESESESSDDEAIVLVDSETEREEKAGLPEEEKEEEDVQVVQVGPQLRVDDDPMDTEEEDEEPAMASPVEDASEDTEEVEEDSEEAAAPSPPGAAKRRSIASYDTPIPESESDDEMEVHDQPQPNAAASVEEEDEWEVIDLTLSPKLKPLRPLGYKPAAKGKGRRGGRKRL